MISCSVFALLSLHLFMYGCNLFMWKSTRINYNFIFEFQPTTALKYRDAFLICTTFMTSVVASMVIHLLLRANGFSPTHVDAIPGILLLVSFAAVLSYLFSLINIDCAKWFPIVLLPDFHGVAFLPIWHLLSLNTVLLPSCYSQHNLLSIL